MTFDRPNEAGLWTREGKFYRVWIDSCANRFRGDEIKSDGHLGCYIDETLTGNWRKLVSPVTSDEARAEFAKEIWNMTSLSQHSVDCIADKAAEIFAGVQLCPSCAEIDKLFPFPAEEPKLLSEVEDQVASVKIALDEAKAPTISDIVGPSGPVKLTPAGRVRTICGAQRSQIIALQNEIKELQEHRDRLYADLASALAPPPEVIEGKGQAVTKEQEGWYWWQSSPCPYQCSCAAHKNAGDVFSHDTRYIKVYPPTFPLRPKFVPPPKPEHLVRHRTTGLTEWCSKGADGYVTPNGNFWRQEIVELLDPASGAVIQG